MTELEFQHKVTQEIIFLSVQDAVLHFRVERVTLPPFVAPDANLLIYLALMGWDVFPDRLAHSTSWRYEESLGLVLTWVVVPDPLPEHAEPLAWGAIMQGESHAPVPVGLDVDAVARHAVRHIAFLLHTDKAVGFTLHHYPELHDALISLHPDVAGNPHSEVLRVASPPE